MNPELGSGRMSGAAGSESGEAQQSTPQRTILLCPRCSAAVPKRKASWPESRQADGSLLACSGCGWFLDRETAIVKPASWDRSSLVGPHPDNRTDSAAEYEAAVQALYQAEGFYHRKVLFSPGKKRKRTVSQL